MKRLPSPSRISFSREAPSDVMSLEFSSGGSSPSVTPRTVTSSVTPRTATRLTEPALSFGEEVLTFSASDAPRRVDLECILGAPPSDINDFYDFEVPLGRGRYGRVFRCSRKVDGIKFAVKRVVKQREWNRTDARRLVREIETMQRLDHPHIVRLVETFESAHDVHLVMELCAGGELFEHIVERDHLTPGVARLITQQLCDAVAYCHSRDVTHRDLKPENVLLVQSGVLGVDMRAPLFVKVIDFGLSAGGNGDGSGSGSGEGGLGLSLGGGGKAPSDVLDNEGSEDASEATTLDADGGSAPVLDLNLRSVVGTAGYMAPEIRAGGSYTRAVDSFSMGVILYTMLCGCSPFSAAEGEDAEFRNALLRHQSREMRIFYDFKPWPSVDAGAIDLVQQLLHVEPTKRLTPEECLHHPWICGSHGGQEVKGAAAFVVNTAQRLVLAPTERDEAPLAELRALVYMRSAIALRAELDAFERSVFAYALSLLEVDELAVLEAEVHAARGDAAEAPLERADAVAACTRNMFFPPERVARAFRHFCRPPYRVEERGGSGCAERTSDVVLLPAAASSSSKEADATTIVDARNIDAVLSLSTGAASASASECGGLMARVSSNSSIAEQPEREERGISRELAIAHAMEQMQTQSGSNAGGEQLAAVEREVDALFTRFGAGESGRLGRVGFEKMARVRSFYWRPGRLER